MPSTSGRLSRYPDRPTGYSIRPELATRRASHEPVRCNSFINSRHRRTFTPLLPPRVQASVLNWPTTVAASTSPLERNPDPDRTHRSIQYVCNPSRRSASGQNRSTAQPPSRQDGGAFSQFPELAGSRASHLHPDQSLPRYRGIRARKLVFRRAPSQDTGSGL